MNASPSSPSPRAHRYAHPNFHTTPTFVLTNALAPSHPLFRLPLYPPLHAPSHPGDGNRDAGQMRPRQGSGRSPKPSAGSRRISGGWTGPAPLVLLIGATGELGRPVLESLIKDSELRVRCLVRDVERAQNGTNRYVVKVEIVDTAAIAAATTATIPPPPLLQLLPLPRPHRRRRPTSVDTAHSGAVWPTHPYTHSSPYHLPSGLGC